MDIQLEKLELIKLLAETEDPSILKSIRKIFKKEQKDWWDDLTEEQKADFQELQKWMVDMRHPLHKERAIHH